MEACTFYALLASVPKGLQDWHSIYQGSPRYNNLLPKLEVQGDIREKLRVGVATR